MANTIDAFIEFSFKGENYEFHSTLDLDQQLERHMSLESMHHVMAVEHCIDTYSYLFEVMQMADIHFDNPQGRAADYLHDGEFDFEAYAAENETVAQLAPLQAIALREMGVEDLEQQPQLKQALLRAYRLGLEQNSHRR
ncbi:MAG: hypothetical protein KJ850_02515 [Gammaproteobacteria bacterium]|nr:hypothetical protein [Gammaproteobacteria bacterium]MBU1623897.1 hypothetical protein [Gammaproteobacteria bacterium]MBU1982114.1 hypothetical protein [Gammaproteobacteria bacterium]